MTTGATQDPEPFSAALRALPGLAASADEGPRLKDMLDRLGSRAHGTAILLLALPDSLPLPVPSIGAVLGVPLIVVSAHLAVFGERGTLPRRALDLRLPLPAARLISERIAPVLARVERWSRPRLPAIAGKERPAGVACLLLSLLLFLPIPLVNMPLALGLVILAWGLVQRDGIVVGIGLAYAAALVLVVVEGLAALLQLLR
jgi:hypothetical protein